MALQSLQRFDAYDKSTFKLESYPTPANIAAAILFAAEMDHGDIEGKVVCDLGCGDGIFAHGAALLGAKRVIGIDLDQSALDVAQENATLLDTEEIVEFVLGDVSSFSTGESFDTVFQNPPFGVRNRGADVIFLNKAISIARVVYSIHLAGEDGKNRSFLTSKIEEMGGTVTQIETFQFPIKAIYERHTKQKHNITVDLYRIMNET
jgi:putative methylase